MQHIHCVQSLLPSRDQATASQITQLSKISYKRWTSGVHETVMAVVSLNRKLKKQYIAPLTPQWEITHELWGKSKMNLKKKKKLSHQQNSSGESKKPLTKLHRKGM